MTRAATGLAAAGLAVFPHQAAAMTDIFADGRMNDAVIASASRGPSTGALFATLAVGTVAAALLLNRFGTAQQAVTTFKSKINR